MKKTYFITAGLTVLLAAVPCVADDDNPNDLSGTRRLTFGVHLQAYPLKMFKTSVQTSSTTKPIADYTYTGSTDSPKVGFGPAVEYRITNHLSVGVEALFHRIQYKEVVEIRDLKKDPNASTDARLVTTLTETTRATTWETPFLARYYGFRERGMFARLYAVGGGSYRRTGTIRTGNEISNANSTTDYNEKAAKASKPNQMGIVGGFGIRFIDNFKLRIAPEVRVTRWQNYNLQGTSYKAVQNDIQGGIGITF